MIFNDKGVAILQAEDGIDLHCRSWLPAVPPKGLILIIHGFGEHIGRYNYVADRLTKSSYAVYGYDLRGHGRSEGRRAFINTFDELVLDTELVLRNVRKNFPELPCYLLAHSMGSTIALKMLIDRSPVINGVVLAGTTIQAGSDIPAPLVALSGLVGDLAPRLPTVKLDAHALSKDPDVVTAYQNDPFVYTRGIPARSGASMNRAFSHIKKNLGVITMPLLILHGEDDRISNPSGSRLTYAKVGSADKTLHVYPGLNHEIMNEPEKDEVLDRIIDWLGSQILKTPVVR